MTAPLAPIDRIVVLGLADSGAELIGEILTAVGVSRDVDATEPKRCWMHDPATVFATSDSFSPDTDLLILTDRDDAAVASALATRFSVAPDIATATWQTYRDRARQLLPGRRHIVVDIAALTAGPDHALPVLVDRLMAVGVEVDPTWMRRRHDLDRAIDDFVARSLVASPDPPAIALRSDRAATDLTLRLDALESAVRRHEAAIVRASGAVATVRRRLSAREEAPPPSGVTAPALAPADGLGQLTRAAEDERARLTQIVATFGGEIRALLSSRRWRIGDRLVRALSPRVAHRRDELASTRLLRLLEEAEAIQLMSLSPLAPPEQPKPEPVATVPAPPLMWHHPMRRSYDVIVLANVCWRSRQQRPHHLARTFARQGHRVFYVATGEGQLGQEALVEEGVIEVEFTPSRTYDRYSAIPDADLVAEWMTAMEALRQRHGIDDAAVHVHLQSWTPLAWELRGAYGWPIVYDCMDEWEDFPGMARELLSAERELVEGADLVVTTAESLRRKWLPHNPNTHLVRNGVDAEFFCRTCLPSDLLADVDRPIVGFTGALASWVDFKLIAAVARARPDWTFVLVGDVFVEPEALCGLDRMDNVVMTGLQPYVTMPLYLFWFDVAVIPFVVDAISASVDPVKFYEYAASGTPVVTTPLPELDEYRPLFYEGSDARTFELAIERALDESPDCRSARVAVAEANTWTDRYARLDLATRSLWTTVSVIIVTYGQLAHTRRCIESVIANTSHPSLEVIVVDNGSTDGTPAYLRHVAEQDRRVTVILNGDNRGFAAANNQGLDVATGDVLILLNNDTEVSPGWHVPLLQHLNDPTVGLIGPRSDNVGNIARIEVPPEFIDDLAGFTRALRRRHDGELFEIGMLGMFCVAMRAEVYRAIGPLDEGYGVGLFEDDDFAERVRAAGWRVVCARDAFVHHVGQATFKSLIHAGEYDSLWARNQARFESRWGRWRAQEDGLEPDITD